MRIEPLLRAGGCKYRAAVAHAVWCVLILALTANSKNDCTPEYYFLFRSDAQVRLDSLMTNPTKDNTLERLVLMHNLAFHGDKERRNSAEKMLDREFPKKKRPPLVKAYGGSLKMIKVSHRTAGAKVFRTLNPLTKSPYAEAREGYRRISEAIALDSTNHVIRVLRATAAAESAEHLNELFDSTRIDLEWLEVRRPESDSVCQFLLHLNWAKYYFKLAKRSHSESDRLASKRHADLAAGFACNSVYRDWAMEWASKIRNYTLSGNNQK